MEKSEEIATYLRTAYNPEAIVLHGSRAIGKERAHSDWDILMLFVEEPAKKSSREGIAGEDVEWKGFVLPIAADCILDDFGVVLQNAKVLWERTDEGTTLLRMAHVEYAKGAQITDEERVRFRRFLEHKLHGLEDDKDTPYMFLRHLSEFFMRASNWWFEILHDEHRKPFYIALPEIQKRDPAYYELLMTLCDDESKEKKIEAARAVVAHLFPSS